MDSVVGWFGTSTDITRQKAGEESVRRHLEEAEAAIRLKDAFLATLSHELRTPMNAMLGWIDMLRRGYCRRSCRAGPERHLQERAAAGGS